ncbi:MAG: glycosyltransferase [Actinomycetota bacterium]
MPSDGRDRSLVTIRATVVVPTFDHGPTLERSVPSALAQTVEDIEVFVVGDGVLDATREIVARLSAVDDRVRFFDNPKGPGNGEIHRHAALREASGRVVAYLSDDDLWMPEHLEELERLLADADFAHTYPIRVEPDGSIGDWSVDLALPWYREAMLAGTNFVPLVCAGHTLAFYRKLPHGWRTRPDDTWSDLYMWQQILSVPDVRVASGARPTVLHLPSSLRRGWSGERRLKELDDWLERMSPPGWREEVYAATLARSHLGQTGTWQALQERRTALEDLQRHIGEVQRSLGERVDHIERLHRDREEERRSLEGQIADLRAQLEARKREVEAITATRTWRWRERLVRTPVIRRLARRGGLARSRPGAG